jgi:eukaryotic-like serine/threonine-protein kinase
MAQPTGQAGSSKQPDPARPAGTAPADKPERIGKYEIRKKIGAGGMGTVYLAVDTILNRSVALKVLPREKAKNVTLVRRFKSEAQAAANLRHENIVTVFEAGESDGYLYIALEYVEGTDGANLVQRRGMVPVKRSLEIIRQVALALEHARQQGIVHRDIKPGNLLIRRDGQVKLADLGLARAVDDTTDTSITRAGTTVGTVDYMAPEQGRDSKAADIRSDIYSLGCTWYFLLTGTPPFPEGSVTNKLRAHAERPLPDPRDLNPAVSEALVGVMRRMVEKDPNKRYQTPTELLADLDAGQLTTDNVAETIFADIEEETRSAVKKPRRVSARDGDDAGSRASSHKPPRKDQESSRAEWTRKAAFYSVVGLLVIAIIAGIVSLFIQYDKATTISSSDSLTNPFAGEAPPSEAGPNANTKTKNVAGSNTPEAPSGIPANEPDKGLSGQAKTTIGGDASTDPKVSPGDVPPTAGGTGQGRITVGTGSGAVVGSNTGVPGTGKSSGGGTITGGGLPKATPKDPPASKRAVQEDAHLSEWAAKWKRPAGLAQFSVGGTVGNSAQQFATLNEALANLPAQGAVIRLVGAGPFPLLPAVIENKTHVTIESAAPNGEGYPPVIVIVAPRYEAAARPPSVSILHAVQTTIELKNLHLVGEWAGQGTSFDDAVVRVSAGDLIATNCSLTLTGAGERPLTAFILAPWQDTDTKASPPSRALIDSTVIRGNNLAALGCTASFADLVLRRSVLWSGQAPALRFPAVADKLALARTGSAGQGLNRQVRLISATVCSSQNAVWFGGDPQAPAPTAFLPINSLFAAPGDAQSAALFALEGFSRSDQEESLGKKITWKSVDTLYTGWKILLRLDPAGLRIAENPTHWQAAWREQSGVDRDHFQPANWPARAIADVTTVELDTFAPESLGKQYVKTADGGWPGCAIAGLTLGGLSAQAALEATTRRAALPAGVFDGAVAQQITIDAGREDVGKALEKVRLANGTLVTLTGSGVRPTSPIVIRNAWIRLRFQPSEGHALVLTPQLQATKGAANDALLSVINGGVEIVGGAFSIPPGDRTAIPDWMFRITDGDLALRRCRIQGALSADSGQKGLILWDSSTGQIPPRLFQGESRGYAAFDECLLLGSGTLFEADMSRRSLFLRNCVALSRNDLFALDLKNAGPRIDAALDFETNTFVSGGSFFRVQGAPSASRSETPLTVYADRCAFVAEPNSSKPGALLSCSATTLSWQQMTWLERRCGYSASIASFLTTGDAASEGGLDFNTNWIAQWGAGRIIEPLLGPRGVVFQNDIWKRAEDLAQAMPVDFAFDPTSQAAIWGHGSPIGAPVDQMRVPPIRGKSASSKGNPGKTKPAPKKKTTPSAPAF